MHNSVNIFEYDFINIRVLVNLVNR
jgi:hypothetical protein